MRLIERPCPIGRVLWKEEGRAVCVTQGPNLRRPPPTHPAHTLTAHSRAPALRGNAFLFKRGFKIVGAKKYILILSLPPFNF